MWMAIGTFVLFLGWFFFNGGSTYTLYSDALNPAKVITNTILAGCSGGGVAFFVKKPIHLFYSRCSKERGKYYKTFRAS
jgi:Amt family ammonium transporter